MRNLKDRTWVRTGAPIAGLVLAACAIGGAAAPAAGEPAPQASSPISPPPSPQMPQARRYPTLANAAVTPATARSLGVFGTEAEAVAAARAAGLGAGIYGLAIAGGVPVAITADGTVYLREPGIADAPGAMSGPAQRPPQ